MKGTFHTRRKIARDRNYGGSDGGSETWKRKGGTFFNVTHCFPWRSQRGSNPRFRRERAGSWATRRWDHLAEEPGFEPGKPGPEPGVMPFHHSSTENAGYPSRRGAATRESRRERATLQRCFSNLVFRPSGVYP